MQKKFPTAIFVTDTNRSIGTSKQIEAFLQRHPAGAVLLRTKKAAKTEKKIQRLCKKLGKNVKKRLIVAQFHNSAVQMRVGGLHFPEKKMRQRGTINIRCLRKRLFITAACHSLASVRIAHKMKVDAILVSPIFPTQSHPEGKSLGLLRFRQLIQHSTLPVYAMGGVTLKNSRLLRHCKIKGIAAAALFQE